MSSGPQASPARTVLAFDGDCGFCENSVRLIRERARPRIAAAPWQALPEELTGPHLARLDREVVLFHRGTARYGGVDAVSRFLGSSPARRYRAAGFVLRLPFVRPFAHLVYRWVAANRHRMPGSTAACAVPRPPG